MGRATLNHDADITLLTGFGNEAVYVEHLLTHFEGRVQDARSFALQYRVVLAYASNGVPLDIALGAMPFEERSVERATPFIYADGYRLLTCSAEDLIVHKAFAGRPQDWLDIEGILIRQGAKLDWRIVWFELEPLAALKEDLSLIEHLRSLAQLTGKRRGSQST